MKAYGRTVAVAREEELIWRIFEKKKWSDRSWRWIKAIGEKECAKDFFFNISSLGNWKNENYNAWNSLFTLKHLCFYSCPVSFQSHSSLSLSVPCPPSIGYDSYTHCLFSPSGLSSQLAFFRLLTSSATLCFKKEQPFFDYHIFSIFYPFLFLFLARFLKWIFWIFPFYQLHPSFLVFLVFFTFLPTSDITNALFFNHIQRSSLSCLFLPFSTPK